jgi:outer membrane immunogenic protein
MGDDMKNSKLIGLATAFVGAIVGIGGAYAADLPVKAPVVVAPTPSWAGFYIGGNAGAGSGEGTYTLSPAGCFLTGACGGGAALNPLRTFTEDHLNTFFVGGAQAGYNWQAGNFVYGLEGDINYNGWNNNTNIIYTLAAPLAGTFTTAVNTKLNWFGTVRGRIGVAASPTVLIFGTGGLAYGQVSSSTFGAFSIGVADTYVGTASSTRAGWTVGGGIEWLFLPNWSLKWEYLFIDLGKLKYTDGCISPAGFCTGFVPAPAYATSVQFREQVARIGINYHFNPPAAPVVVKY